ncbi:type II toxin-antitoxin system YafQ family toxin [Moraxella catarrhalis]|uniref:type II toxin-antitoxin system YafQ family toxin n=1 Tax=Moraxella catarrhalis TaxID=480 RepID=UPI00128CCF6C|nr:type II toxin-antitoxin system YafQ family toxin [Moraxella catarrhalis]MPX07613.1 type II toxin-antitoxin system mRNA interferase toxin, RelE/StbE family [Moraxella catarrhalis]
MPAKYKDHAPTGNWQGWCDCHVANDLVLIYKIDDGILHLARLNSHSEVFG